MSVFPLGVCADVYVVVLISSIANLSVVFRCDVYFRVCVYLCVCAFRFSSYSACECVCVFGLSFCFCVCLLRVMETLVLFRGWCWWRSSAHASM